MAEAGDTTIQNQQLVERLLDDLHKLMWTMVWDVANSSRWQLEPEEVYAELCLELVKLVDRYYDKPFLELKKLSVTSMRNRIHDLATACYLTNRKAEALMFSIDSSAEEDQTSRGDASLEIYDAFPTSRYGESYASNADAVFDIVEFCSSMSDDAKKLVAEVLNPSERTAHFLRLTAQRKQNCNPKGFWTLTITPLIMARSLGWTMERLKATWKEVGSCISNDNTF